MHKITPDHLYMNNFLYGFSLTIDFNILNTWFPKMRITSWIYFLSEKRIKKLLPYAMYNSLVFSNKKKPVQLYLSQQELYYRNQELFLLNKQNIFQERRISNVMVGCC